MNDSYDGGDSRDDGEVSAETSTDSGEEVSAFEDDSPENVESEVTGEGEDAEDDGYDASAFQDDEKEESGGEGEDVMSPDRGADRAAAAAEGKEDRSAKEETDYSRPTHWRSGMRDTVWDSAKDEHGRVRDPGTGRYMSKDQPWDMGHKPGYEFRKHQDSAEKRGISRKEFLDEYYDSDHYRPELPSSNRSHKGENVTDEYFGD